MTTTHHAQSRAKDALQALAYAFDFRTPSDLAALGPYYGILKAVFTTVHSEIWETNRNLKRSLPCSIENSFWLSALFLDLYAFIPLYALWTIPKLIEIAMRKCRRPTYYADENARRRKLASDRRKIRRRTTINRKPSPEDLRAQWARVKKSPRDMLLFGSMLEDLEAYVDNSLIRDEDGTIVGRKGGIKKWLCDNCPELWAKYPSVMRFKALAKKFKQVVELEDPLPITVALNPEEPPEDWTEEDEAQSIRDAQALARGQMPEHAKEDGEPKCRENILRCGRVDSQEVKRMARKDFVEQWNAPEAIAGRRLAGRMAHARERARDFMKECTRTERSLCVALACRLDSSPRPPDNYPGKFRARTA